LHNVDFSASVHAKEKRNDAIAFDQIEMKIGYFHDILQDGNVVCASNQSFYEQ